MRLVVVEFIGTMIVLIYKIHMREVVAMAYNEECCNCIHAVRDPGSNSGWYCNYRSTHVYPDEHCYRFESKR